MQDIESSITSYFERVSDKAFGEWDKRIVATSLPLVGVKLPIIKRTARELVKRGLAGEIIDNASIASYEMLLLRGFLIAYDRVNESITLDRIRRYIDDVDNWQCVDNIVSAVHLHDDTYFDFLTGELSGDSEWHIRYGIVGLMTYFDTRLDEALSQILCVATHSYYIDMAIAWAISVAYISMGERVFDSIDNSPHITYDVMKYAKGKVRDSYRLSSKSKDDFACYATSKMSILKHI